jgi:anti-sigma B factor antagonist
MIKTDTTDPQVCVVIPEGERLTVTSATPFKNQVVALVENGHSRFVIDLTTMSFVDSSGLGALVGILKRVGNRGEIVLCGLSDSVRQMFKITRMDQVFTTYPTRSAAVAALREAS